MNVDKFSPLETKGWAVAFLEGVQLLNNFQNRWNGGNWFDPELRSLCILSFACSPHFSVNFLWDGRCPVLYCCLIQGGFLSHTQHSTTDSEFTTTLTKLNWLLKTNERIFIISSHIQLKKQLTNDYQSQPFWLHQSQPPEFCSFHTTK